MIKLSEKEIRAICLLARSKGINADSLNLIVKENITYKKICERLLSL